MTLRILVVCTANQCRSPMAEALLKRRLPDVVVSSAGSLSSGRPASGGSVRAMSERGIDITNHRSSMLSAALIDGVDLVVTMTRGHLREVVVTAPGSFPRTFTLRELVRRGEAVGPAGALGEWLARVGEGRHPAEMMGDSPADDLADPIGGPDSDYEATAVLLEDLTDRLSQLLEGAVQP